MTKLTGLAHLDDAITRADVVIENLYQIEQLLLRTKFARYVNMLDTAGALVFAVKEALGAPE